MGAITEWVNVMGRLRCEGIWLMTPAWTITEDISAMVLPSEYRGKSDTIAGQRGRLPQPQQPDEASFVFRFPIAGDCNEDGEPYANHRAGYYSNLFRLATITNPVDVLVAEDGCRDLEFHFPDDAYPMLTQRAQLSLDLSGVVLDGSDRTGSPALLKRALLRITLPNGFFG